MTFDEDEAMARAAGLDPREFAAIYERHRTPVYRYLRSRTASDDEAGELCAVTFERALAAIDRFRSSGGGMIAWLLRIARNAHIDDVRRTDRHPLQTDRLSPEPSSPIDPDLEDAVILRSLIAGLPATQRDAIQLRFAAGLTAREIGIVLGMTEGAAQKQLERALTALREVYRVD